MFETIGLEKAIPRAKSIDDAVVVCHQFYTPEQEKEFGVLAIYFKVLPESSSRK
jgi:ASC-1-like (ASCH) protein